MRRLGTMSSALVCAVCLAAAADTPPAPPRLAVVISIDQCRYDYLGRFQAYLGPDGFNRLIAHGAVYQDARYRHAVLSTAPGHATILTGVYPAVHGIVANDWFDAAAGRMVGAVEDRESPLVGFVPVAPVPALLAGRGGRSPARMMATTVGDQLKARFGARSRVIAVANKDRGAILLGGRLADAAYWLEGGRFVTSRYYREALPGWVETFNAEGRVERDFGRTWDRLLPADAYEALQGPDDASGEESRLGLGTTFPRRVDGGLAQVGQTFYEAHRLTPFATELLGDFVEATLRGEQLGRHDAPDLLCVGFSQIDYAGHSYGPDSHEIMDAMVRMDRVVARMLRSLDELVGPDSYLVVLTADHGVTPLPERMLEQNRGVEAGRFDGPAMDRVVEAGLTTQFGSLPGGGLWVMRDAYGYHVRTTALEAAGVPRERVAEAVRDLVREQSCIAESATSQEVLAAADEGDTLAARWRRSHFPGRSQDVVFILRPWFVDRMPAGTNHGGPYTCDEHVPLVWFGAGVTAGTHAGRVGIESLAPTLAARLGVEAPPQAQAPRLF